MLNLKSIFHLFAKNSKIEPNSKDVKIDSPNKIVQLSEKKYKTGTADGGGVNAPGVDASDTGSNAMTQD